MRIRFHLGGLEMATWQKKNKSPGDRVPVYHCSKCGRRRSRQTHYPGTLCATCIRRAREGNV